MKSYYFGRGENAPTAISTALNEIFGGKAPVICCIGTDAVSGDSLGPLVGTMLQNKLLGKTYIYGTLDKPISAKDVSSLSRFIKAAHNGSKILAVDAALGKADETGYIKAGEFSIKPGLGVEKDLTEIGNASIIAIVEEKQRKNLLSSVRLSMVYCLASKISEGISKYFDNIPESTAIELNRRKITL